MLVLEALINGEVDFLPALFQVLDDSIVELLALDYIGVPSLTHFLIEDLLLTFIVIGLAGVHLNELLALFEGLFKVLQVLRVLNVLHHVFLEVSHLELKVLEEVSNHGLDLLFDQLGIGLLHLSHGLPILLILLREFLLELLHNDGCELETLNFLLKDRLVAIELPCLIIVSNQGLPIDRTELRRGELR